MIKPDSVDKFGQILDIIVKQGFLIANLRMAYVDAEQGIKFYKEHSSKPFMK
jgi:nucleoside diphosphate kinase